MNKDEYMDVLEKSVAHGMYTALPYVNDGNTYLFAHSKISDTGTTPEGGWFTRIDELEIGDPIYLIVNEKTYKYSVQKTFIVDPLDTKVYSGVSPFPEHRAVTLQTCWPKGTTENRLIVQAISE